MEAKIKQYSTELFQKPGGPLSLGVWNTDQLKVLL